MSETHHVNRPFTNLQDLLHRVESFPSSGMVDAVYVNGLLREAVQIIDATKKTSLHNELSSLDRVEYAQDQSERVLDQNIRLAAQNAVLIKNNRVLSFIAAGVVVLAVVVEVCCRLGGGK